MSASNMKSRKATARQQEIQLKATLKQLQEARTLNDQLIRERDDSEEELKKLMDKNTVLRSDLVEYDYKLSDAQDKLEQLQSVIDTFNQCASTHEVALKRITNLEEELGAANEELNYLRKERQCYDSLTTQNLYQELVGNNDKDRGVWSLKNLTITVPRAVPSGEGQAAVLRCSYDLEGAALYSIRWYRGETEFYRYVPRELPPSMVFPLPGASVDLTQSDHQQVRIVNLNRRLSGDYQCEVSADAPLFHTDIRWAPLTVVDPPFRAPRLSVSRDSYARGDVIRANCTVDEAYPAPNITWIVDDHKIAETIPEPPSDLDFSERGASSHLELTVLETEQYRVGLTYTSASIGRAPRDPGPEPSPRRNLTIRYTMVPPPSGQFVLGCVTTIFDIYARKSETVAIREDTPRPESVTGEDSAGTLPTSSLFLLCACALHAL